MQCSMLPRIRYLEAGRMLLKQKETVRAKMRPFTKSRIIHLPGFLCTDRLAKIYFLHGLGLQKRSVDGTGAMACFITGRVRKPKL